MPYTKNLDYRHMSNTRISSRLKQVLVLIAVILVGMIVSASVNAIPSSRKAPTAQVNSASVSQKLTVR